MEWKRVLSMLIVLLLTTSGHRGDAKSVQKNSTGEHHNLDMTCAARTILNSGQSYYSSSATTTIKYFRLVYYSLLSVLGLSLNSFVVYLVARRKKLQILSFGIALQVVIVDVLFSIARFVPILVTTTTAGMWILGPHVCVAVSFLALSLALYRIYFMFVFVVDRFVSIFYPFFYQQHRIKMAIILSWLSWVFVPTVCLPSLPNFLDCYGYSIVLNSCTTLHSCSTTCSTYRLYFFALVALPATVIPVSMYMALYCKGRSLRKLTPSVVTGTDEDQRRAEEEHQRERRATFTFLLLFISLFVIISPSVITTLLIDRLYPSQSDLPLGVYVIQVLAGAVSGLLVIMDPIVILRDRDVREILSEMKASLVRKWNTIHPCNTNEEQ